jgi:uncharacterized paraquat-inducible protein A
MSAAAATRQSVQSPSPSFLRGYSDSMSLLSCPHCHLAIHPRADFLAPEYCPRCLARRRRAEPMSYIAEPARPRVMHQQRDMLAPPVPPAPPAS